MFCSIDRKGLNNGLLKSIRTCDSHQAMSKMLFQRIFAALLVLSFVVVLPMQGIATAVSATTSSVPWAGGAENPTPGDCVDCNSIPSMSALCPAVFCVGITGIVLEKSGVEKHSSDLHLRSISVAGVGIPIPPDLDPPQLFI